MCIAQNVTSQSGNSRSRDFFIFVSELVDKNLVLEKVSEPVSEKIWFRMGCLPDQLVYPSATSLQELLLELIMCSLQGKVGQCSI